ncbi:MAG: hypothetical protein ACOH1Y_09230 [Propionicimonas sp.]
MIVDVIFDYWELGVVPPRCRNPRDVLHADVTQVLVPEVTSLEAPVAMSYQYATGDWVDEYRWWGNTLWEPFLPWSGQLDPTVPGSDQFPTKVNVRGGWDIERNRHQDYAAALAAVPTRFGGYLIIDGLVWRTAGEPRYEIHTLGLGHNHSSSGLGVANHYNGNIGRSRYFRADQHQEAKAEAVRVALARGDTLSVPRIEKEPAIKVLIPISVRCRPEVEAGEGDPFLNRLYVISEGAGSVLEAGVLTVLTTLAADR